MIEFLAQTANGQSSVEAWHGGPGNVAVDGTPDGATMKLQMRPPGGSVWLDVGADVTFSAVGVAGFTLKPCDLRLDLSSVGASTDLNGRVW